MIPTYENCRDTLIDFAGKWHAIKAKEEAYMQQGWSDAEIATALQPEKVFLDQCLEDAVLKCFKSGYHVGIQAMGNGVHLQGEK